MFPDLARDDMFRLETPRLCLRWPRVSDAAAIHRFCCLWEVARYTARIPHPYPAGSAERFVYAARQGNASGRELSLVVTPARGKREAIGSISIEKRGADRLALGFVLAPEVWGKGFATEAAQAMIEAGFALTPAVEILASVQVENAPSKGVLEKCGFTYAGAGPLGAPARGGMVPCLRFRLGRDARAESGALRSEAFAGLAPAS